MMARPTNCLEFKNRHQWRMWLEKNHNSSKEVWLILYKKKYQDQGLTLDDAVEEALCFGWIDGTLRSIDEKRFALRYSPRTKNSIWSMRNILRIERLIAEGKMTVAGRLKIAEAKKNGEWEAAIRREQVDVIPEDLEAALKERKEALESYIALPASRKKHFIFWLQTAKQEKTKRQRIKAIIRELLKE
jgi:uncharacterized protein YdeI (YjbR/CyaY-like superfamily)